MMRRASQMWIYVGTNRNKNENENEIDVVIVRNKIYVKKGMETIEGICMRNCNKEE